ncbi:hypothetical protein QBC37DRAFT_369171 [Rhypophila decipiens]|uniref:Uncharacterized protein n=1 Tax=Rhypophila decipiens TaxID=261697 RepID=A0AAN6YIB2_9PEZI|nr:hypothetical protein QBC37DRAFT_369171 [Rhypophila decipiens]
MPLRRSKSLPTLWPPQPQPEPPGPIVPSSDYMPPRPSNPSLTSLGLPPPHNPPIYARLCPPSPPAPPPSLSSVEIENKAAAKPTPEDAEISIREFIGHQEPVAESSSTRLHECDKPSAEIPVAVEDSFNKRVRACKRLADEILVAVEAATRAFYECAKAPGQVPIAVSSLAPGPTRLDECSKPSAGFPVVVEDSLEEDVRACERLAEEILVLVADATRAFNKYARASGQAPIDVSSLAPGPTEGSTEVNEHSVAELTRLADEIIVLVADVTQALNEYVRASGQAPIVVWSPAPGPTEESTGASNVNEQPAARSSEMRGNESAETEIAPVEEPKAIPKAPWVLRLHPYSPRDWVGRRRKRVIHKKVRRDFKETARRSSSPRTRRRSTGYQLVSF